MSEIKQLIAQHSGSVALSFSKLGIPAPVTEKNVIKVAESYGEPYWELLEDIINSGIGYAGTDLSVMYAVDDAITISGKYANGNIYDTGPLIPKGTPPWVDPQIFTTQEGPYPVMQQLPLPVMPLPTDQPVLIGNGGMLTSEPNSSIQTVSPTVVTMQVDDQDEKTFWQKHSTLIIVVIIILLILLLRGRSNAAPVIIK